MPPIRQRCPTAHQRVKNQYNHRLTQVFRHGSGEPPQRDRNHGNFDHLLHAVKLQAQGRQSGGQIA